MLTEIKHIKLERGDGGIVQDIGLYLSGMVDNELEEILYQRLRRDCIDLMNEYSVYFSLRARFNANKN